MIDPEQVLAIWLERKNREGPWAARAREVRDLYGGDIAVPLPELEKNEKPAVANLAYMGINQMGTRAASVLPDIQYPVRNSGVKSQVAQARKKRQANFGWWDANHIGLKMYRRGRWLLAYAKAPVIIRPDFQMDMPRWDLRDPLGVYEGDRADPENPLVPDVVSSVKRTYKWLAHRYPEQMAVLAKPRDCAPDYKFDVLEWIDHDCILLAVVGATVDDRDGWDQTPSAGAKTQQLEYLPNRAGYCTAVVPTTIGLDSPRGQFDGMVGLYQMQSRLMALEVIAVEKGIFPNEWLVSDGTLGDPQIVQVADGRRGIIGKVKNGSLRQIQDNPGYQTFPTIDRLERAQRLNGGVPADFGGESQNNVRTGRRGENLLSATIDFTLQECQQIFAASLEAENRCAIAVAKGYLDTSKSFYVSWAGAEGQVDYKPSELFDTDRNVVTYAQAGSDVNGLVISMGQRVGMGVMSKRTFMEKDPLIADPEVENDRVVVEALEAAYLQGVQARAANGDLPDVDLIRVMELVRTDKKDLVAAVQQAQREAQERQAQQAPPGSPELQPGLSMPGMGVEAAPAPVQAQPTPEELASVLRNLRNGQRMSAAERGPAEAIV